MITDNDYNIIKPVESPQHTSTLTPVKPREQRKRKQQPGREKSQRKLNQPPSQQQTDDPPPQDGEDQHSIDYCA
jgi:hypothetical protein